MFGPKSHLVWSPMSLHKALDINYQCNNKNMLIICNTKNVNFSILFCLIFQWKGQSRYFKIVRHNSAGYSEEGMKLDVTSGE